MLWNLVNLFMGSLPQEFEFMKIFGILFIMYIFIRIFNMFIEVIKEMMRW